MCVTVIHVLSQFQDQGTMTDLELKKNGFVLHMYDTESVSVPGMEGRYSMQGGGGGDILFEDVPLVEFLSFMFTHIPGDSYHR